MNVAPPESLAQQNESLDAIEHPALGWWILIPSGLGVLASLSYDESAYVWWRAHVMWLPPASVLSWVFIAAALAHATEAYFANAIAARSGFHRSRAAWTLQTLCLGFPSLRLLRRKAARIQPRS